MKKCSKTLLGLALAAAMSLSLIVPASAVYCPHDYYASTAVWYTDDGPPAADPALADDHPVPQLRLCRRREGADAPGPAGAAGGLFCSGVPQSAGDRLRPGGGISPHFFETKA